MDELTREFLIESREGLDRMEGCLSDLEKWPTDAAPIAENIARLVRYSARCGPDFCHQIQPVLSGCILGARPLQRSSHEPEIWSLEPQI
jgi:hypothetical protein